MTSFVSQVGPALQNGDFVLRLHEATLPELVGAKAHNLCRVSALGLRVPSGIVVTNRAFEAHLAENDLATRIDALVQSSNPGEFEHQRQLARSIHDLIVNSPLSPKFKCLLVSASEELLHHGAVVVRSSALGEDSLRASFAGQLDSFLHIRTQAALENALLACWASCWSHRAIAYRAAQRLEVRGMGVVVQSQVEAIAAGVLFTRTADGQILIEHTDGLGDALVSGRIEPGRFLLQRDGKGFHVLCVGEQPARRVEKLLFSRYRLAELARLAAILEETLGGPQDVEWVIDQSRLLQVVQSRPITATVSLGTTPADARRVYWSNANVNENFPAPVSPFLYSIVSAGYAHYFRNLASAFGLSRRRIAAIDDALRHIVGVHGARLYYNLTNIHTVLRNAPFGDGLVAAFNTFVGAGGSLGTVAQVKRGRIRDAVELAAIAVKTTWLYLFLEQRVASFERLVDDFAARADPQRLASLSLHDLRLLLTELMDIRCHRWTNASLADAAAMVCYAVLGYLVKRVDSGKTGSALHNTLLKAIPKLVSSQPVQELWELSRAIRSDAALRTLFERDAESILDQIAINPRFADFRARFEYYLRCWGFRCSEELMLTSPSFQEQPALLVETIRAYSRASGNSPAAVLRKQLDEREEQTRGVLRGQRPHAVARSIPFVTRAVVTPIVLRWTQAAIAYRERARLKQALLYSRCRRLALALGRQLVARGYLAEQEDVFWLSVVEVDELAAGNAMFPHQLRELTAMRRRAHCRLAASHPADAFNLLEGDYLPLDENLKNGDGESSRRADRTPGIGSSHTLKGAGACGGRVSGRAAVLKNSTEVDRVSGADILVTRQTDPGWAPIFFLIKGLVIERGGMLSHGAIVAREFGIPCVVGVPNATRELRAATQVEVDGDLGEVHVRY